MRFDNFSLLKQNFNKSMLQMRQEKSKKYKIEGVRVGGHTVYEKYMRERDGRADRRSKKGGRKDGE
jgi:hypothetical protein